MKKLSTLHLLLLLLLALVLSPSESAGQKLGVKTNALAWATASFNAGLEYGFAPKWTVEVDAIYNPFTWSDGRKTNIWGIQPEIRYWFRNRFEGHFVGLHGHYAMYDWGLYKYRYTGELYGTGLSYGYSLKLSRCWRMEATIGFGHTHLADDYKYDRHDSSICYPPEVRNNWGLTRAGINFTYFLK